MLPPAVQAGLRVWLSRVEQSGNGSGPLLRLSRKGARTSSLTSATCAGGSSCRVTKLLKKPLRGSCDGDRGLQPAALSARPPGSGSSYLSPVTVTLLALLTPDRNHSA